MVKNQTGGMQDTSIVTEQQGRYGGATLFARFVDAWRQIGRRRAKHKDVECAMQMHASL